jgi:hypothetical protein
MVGVPVYILKINGNFGVNVKTMHMKVKLHAHQDVKNIGKLGIIAI